jgi:hypothetical protein
MFALQKRLIRRLPTLDVVFGYLVVTPDQALGIDLEWEPAEHAGPEAMTVDGIAAALRRARRFWRGRQRRSPAGHAYRDLLRFLRPDFDRVRGLADRGTGLEAAYLQLVTAPWSVARRCYRGDLHACTIALGLDPSADPAMTWFTTPGERQSVVLAADFMYQNGRTEPDLQRCREGNDSACTALLHQTPVTSLTRPLDNEARQSVLAIALAMGGRDAYERILTHPDLKPGAELALAAGVPTERVVAVWRDSVLAARSRPVQVNLVETMAGLMWIFGFLGLALRSTRWRIG